MVIPVPPSALTERLATANLLQQEREALRSAGWSKCSLDETASSTTAGSSRRNGAVLSTLTAGSSLLMSDTGSPPSSARVRRRRNYAHPTISCAAPDYANDEQDLLRQSFASGNFSGLRSAVPSGVAPGSVNQHRRQRQEKNRESDLAPRVWSQMVQSWSQAWPQDAPQQSDPYTRQQELAKAERLRSKKQQDKIAPHGWRCTSQEKRLRHEFDSFSAAQETYKSLPLMPESVRLPPSSPYWMRKSMDSASMDGCSSYGEGTDDTNLPFFVAGGRDRDLQQDARSRLQLPLVLRRLQQRLDDDWEGCTVLVCATDQDLVQIAFSMATVDCEKGVLAYMGVLAKDPEVNNMGLRKVGQMWATKRDFAEDGVFSAVAAQDSAPFASTEGVSKSTMMMLNEEVRGEDITQTWMFFLLAPRWVRMLPTDAFYTVHPRYEGSAFRMSTAGSSVLLSLGATSVFGKMAASKAARQQRQTAAVAIDCGRAQVSARRPKLDVIQQALSGFQIAG
eukprot:TRINITY_DN27410_c0_g1_i1.p1 TRINITY_DN27410_c0_g1~~TRINITY_DN27410_c0_g1_i1.p1  ORF type:complete len:506 (+),score=122.74 TRINITY_DN27410_c0_g1_i1:131-1648(+)